MIDTQRLGALLRAWMREDALLQRERTLPVAALRPLAAVGPGSPDAGTAQRAAGEGASLTLSEPLTEGRPRNAAPAPDPLQPAIRQDAAQQAAARNASAQLALSPAGRLLLAALASAADARTDRAGDDAPGGADPAGAPAARGGVNAARPLVAVPPHSEYATDRLALQLKDAVEYSGVFYESHLAQWADDRRPRALLAREPQSGWMPDPRLPSPDASGAAAIAPHAARALVAEQLAVLDSGRFVWQGELWPGQRGTLQIDEERVPADVAGRSPAHAQARWRMRLTLDVPGLGAIDARLAMHGDELALALGCARADSVSALRAAAPVLQQVIAGRALDLQLLSVTHEPDA
jgi:hypothetical protein